MKKIVMFIGCLMLSGCCQKVGPTNLRQDSISYNRAVQNSSDTQLLLNIVRLRYRDNPTFLNIGSVTAGYEFKRSFASDFKFDSINTDNDTIGITPKIGADYTEKPTTSYSPLQGARFVKEIMSPIPIQNLMLLQSSGWRLDRILRCCVQQMNGVLNAPTASGPTPEKIPNYQDFIELTQLFRELEIQNAIEMVKTVAPDNKEPEFYLVIDTEVANPGTLTRIWQILGVDQGLDRIRLVAGHGRKHGRDEIIVDTRSPLSVLYFLSHSVHVPETDQIWGKVTLTLGSDGCLFNWDEVLLGILNVHSGPFMGKHSAVSVCYRGNIFYIDDSDLESKSTFSMISQLIALQSGCPDIPALRSPILTIPVN